MRRLPLVLLLSALTLSACGDADDPVVIDTDESVVVLAPDGDAGDLDSDMADVASADVDEPIAASDLKPSAPATVPPAPPPAPTPKADATPGTTATILSPVTFFNNTGMSISHLYIAGCDESEGSDWNDMKSWAQERLEGNALDPDESTTIQYVDGCYVAEPHYVGGSPISEKVMVSGPTAVDFTIG